MRRNTPGSSSVTGFASPEEIPALLTKMSREGSWRAAAAMLSPSVTSSTSSRMSPPMSAMASLPRAASREPR
jgi:hypothetical protein